MKFETRREREQRIKRQRQSAIIGMTMTVIVVVALGFVLWRGKQSLAAKNKEYESQKASLEQQIDEEQQRTDDLDEYKKYVQTKKFVEEMAKSKFGLIYPDEILFKPNKN